MQSFDFPQRCPQALIAATLKLISRGPALSPEIARQSESAQHASGSISSSASDTKDARTLSLVSLRLSDNFSLKC
jgi:hypothetical protein